MSSVKNLWSTWGSHRYSVLSPATFIAQIFGIFPFSSNGSVGGKKYSTSYALLIYSTAVHAVVLISLSMWMVPYIGNPTRFWDLTLVQITIAVELVVLFFSDIILCASIIFAKKQFTNVIHNLCAQDEALRNLGIKIDYAADFRRSCFRLGVIASIIFAIGTVDFVNKLEDNLRYPLLWITWIFPHVERIIYTCFIADRIVVYKQKLSALNELLWKMIEESRDSPLETMLMRLKICKRFRSVAEIHRNLCNSALKWNQIFGVFIAFEVVGVIMALTIDLYIVVEKIVKQDCNHELFGYVNLTIMNSIHAIYMLIVYHVAQNEANRTGKLIHMLNVPKPDYALDNAIKSFSLQLRDDKIHFSAAGLFSIDATIIRSVVVTMITYAVVMIQYSGIKQP